MKLDFIEEYLRVRRERDDAAEKLASIKKVIDGQTLHLAIWNDKLTELEEQIIARLKTVNSVDDLAEMIANEETRAKFFAIEDTGD